MMTRPPNLRYERKFLAPGISLAEVLALIRRHPAPFSEVFPPRTVNNIYLDSVGLGDYHAHVNGAANRTKTRIRWYGPLHGPIATPALERKIKRGLVSGKTSYLLPAFALNGGVEPHVLERTLDRARLPEDLQLARRHLQPSLVNRYHRHYFLSADRRFRLTVDSNLEFYRPCWTRTSPIHESPHLRTVIIELKFRPEHAEGVAPVATALPFRLSRCSKYVLGLERLAAI